MSRSSFGQISPSTPRIVGIDYFAMPRPGDALGCPVITGQPEDSEIAPGETAIFGVVSSAVSAQTYQWQVSVDDGETWNNITAGEPYDGEKSDTLSVGPANVYLTGYRYRAVITADECMETSAAALLTVAS